MCEQKNLMVVLFMRYAIISDVHGNIFALNAVLEDARAQGVDKFLLLGDYANSFPWGDEVTEVIRGLENTVVIRGNGEGYYINLEKTQPVEYAYEQFKPVYWAHRILSRESLEYLMELPETAFVSDGDCSIYLNHALSVFFRSPRIELFHSRNRNRIMNESPFSHEEYLIRAKAELLDCPGAVADILALPEGIHLFGHNHMQFHMQYEGRLFINPGSCGEPLDWNPSAAYTILICDGGVHTVEERRVEYDLSVAAEALIASEFTAYSPVWSEIMHRELLEGKDYFAQIISHILETGKKMGQAEYAPNNEIWQAAVDTWDINKA